MPGGDGDTLIGSRNSSMLLSAPRVAVNNVTISTVTARCAFAAFEVLAYFDPAVVILAI